METNTDTSYGKCRCCLATGSHRDIRKEYYNNGRREVYLDIFLDCFNLFLTTSNVSTLICSSCIQQLRDASKFRTMVEETEQQLLEAAGDKQTMFVNVPVSHREDNDEDIKLEGEEVQVKMEFNENPDDDHGDFEPDNDDDDDELSIPLSKLNRAYDLSEAERKLLARFPKGTLKKLPSRNSLYTICPNFAKHLDSLKGKIITSKTLQMKDYDKNKIKIVNNVYITEKWAHVQNASNLLECSNVTPFKTKTRSGFPCFYCKIVYENRNTLQEHQINEHKDINIRKNLAKYGTDYLVVYADVTDLKCTVCNQNMPNLNELKSHLIRIHNKNFHNEYTDRVIPFKLSETHDFECQICGFRFETFGSIERHMNTHYRNYICEECGSGFVTKHRLKVHIYCSHVDGNFPCELCKKVYSTHQKYKTHLNAVHRMVKKNKCPKCPERFADYFTRQRHMVKVHGLTPLHYKCNVCDKVFNRRYALSCHMKRCHLEEKNFQCNICAYKCYTNGELKMHMIKHNGERMYECSVCKKSYARKKTLKEHMRIHNNDRRYACSVCGQAFVQNCSLKGHMKTHHLEYIDM